MNKIGRLIIITIILSSLLISPVQAEEVQTEYYDYAVKLSMLGLFRGTGTGYELGREPTRLEGAVMFVRLLGAEQEALAMGYSHPFSDVPQWGSPYVGYLFENELTNGISETEFGSYLPIKAISYMTFALRALGYSDNGDNVDFTWDRALEFSLAYSVFDLNLYSELSSEVFLRDHVARVSFEILKAKSKFSEETLIEKLVQAGAVERTPAENMGLLDGFTFSNTDAYIGHSVTHIMDVFGYSDRTQFSRYGFDWYIYDSDYNKYLQIGIGEDTVKAVLGASYGYSYERGVTVGMLRSELEEAYIEGPLAEYRKKLPNENTIVVFPLDHEHRSTYRTILGDYITYYFDSYDNERIVAILVVDNVVEEETIEGFPTDADDLFYKALEIQVFGLTNALRVQKRLAPLQWDQDIEAVASGHSKDMSDRDYFSHITPEGAGVGDRLTAGGVSYISAGENIAYGYRDPIHMVNDWLNSTTGHREILLGNFENLGVGVWINDDNRMFGTQNFTR